MDENRTGPHICSITTVANTINAFWLEQLCFLEQQGFSVLVVCSHHPVLSEKIKGKLNCRFVEMERGVSYFSTLKNIGQLYRLFRKERFDMIQYATPKAALVSSIAGLMAGVPVRLYCQWGIRYVGFSGWKRRLFQSLERLTCRLSTHISPDSRGNLEFSIAEGLYPACKASVVHYGSANGVNLERFNPAVRERCRDESRRELAIGNAVVFGWVGRITRDKGVYELVEAFCQLSEKGFPAVLLMIGEYEEEPDLPEVTLTLLRTHPRIRCLGKKEEMPRYYAAMDVLVLPSYREGFGVAAIEGQAMGLPVITTDIPGPRESTLHGRSGLLVPPRSVEPLRAAMENLGRDEELRRKMGTAGCEYVTERFEQKTFWQKVLEHRLWLLER